MDGPSAQGFLSLTAFQAEGCGGGFAAGCVEGLCSLRSGGDSACGAEGCGIALTGDEHKVSVTGLAFYAFYVIGMISITSISHLRWLSLLWCLTAPPSRPAGKRVT